MSSEPAALRLCGCRRRAAALALALASFAAASGAQVAVRGDTVYTVAGPPLSDTTVVVRDGRIAEIGPSATVRVPEGFRILTGAVVTPGLVDAHSVVGLAGALNSPVTAAGSRVADQDQVERSAPLQPELRAVDAYNALEDLVGWVRDFGVTTLHTGHGPLAVVSGQTMIVKTRGSTVEEAVVRPFAAVAMTLGPRASSGFESPGTRSKAVAMLRERLVAAREYAEKVERASEDDEKEPPARDLGLEALAAVLHREVPALISAQTVVDITAALRLQREFGFDLLLDGAAEAYLILDEIRQAGVPVLLHPTMMRAGGETRNATMESAAKLQEAGVPFALQTGYEGYVPKSRVLVFEAALAAANGLDFDQALEAITLSPAKILGLDQRVGSLEIGKDGDLVVFDGDPFEYTSHVCGVVIEGEVVSDECH